MKTKDIANQYGLNQESFENYLRESKYQSLIEESNLPDMTIDGYSAIMMDGLSTIFNDGTNSITIDDRADIEEIIRDYKKWEKDTAALAERKAQEEIVKKATLASMLITSGFSFDGYTIVKYSGYISGDDAISVPRGMAIFGTGTDMKDKLMESLVVIRRKALAELKEAAYALGCNAVIGVDFDYLTLDPQTAGLGGVTIYQPYVFGVTANGNAVVIEKDK